MAPNDINWNPLNIGGASFKTRKLNTTDKNRWVYDLSGLMRLFPWFFIGIGSFTGILFAISIILIPAAFVSGLLVIIGVVWRKRLKKGIVFDFGNGFFWRGLKSLNPGTENALKMEDLVRLDEIAGIQILSEMVVSNTMDSGNSRTGGPIREYDSYEMNLVMQDKSRINVVDHANFNAIKREAEAIAKRLNVPVWLADNLK